jgi:hypothetical protein
MEYYFTNKVTKMLPALRKGVASLPLDDLGWVVPLYPTMKYNNTLITSGTYVSWGSDIKVALSDIWDLEIFNPDNAPELWDTVKFKDGYRYIPEKFYPTTKFSLGAKGWWEEELYESLIDSNIYTPVTYPLGWKKVEVDKNG